MGKRPVIKGIFKWWIKMGKVQLNYLSETIN